MIEAKLKEKFSQEDIDEFYEKFKERMAEYNEANSGAVDVLFGFVDFDKFKKNILRHKQDMALMSTDAGNDNEKIVTLQSHDIFWDLIKEDLNDKKLKWKKNLEIKDKKGISCIMHQRPMEGGLSMIRTDMVMKGVSQAAFKRFGEQMFDEEGMKATNPHIREFKLVSEEKVGDTETKIIYSSSKMPMMTERDNLMKMVAKTLPNGD